MQKTPKTDRSAVTKSGILPRPVFEPGARREPPMPTHLPEMRDDEGATTGKLPAIREGHDTTAIGDSDRANGE